ncbi:hypothetical protein Leryth_015382 [Lithospermum erythrorhizon]|nr:hypothetical protein Leryth_015382 [Lithospermum erythrorhizon]
MASTVLRAPTTTLTPSKPTFSLTKTNFLNVSFPLNQTPFIKHSPIIRNSTKLKPSIKLPNHLLKFLPFASNGEAAAETTVKSDVEQIQEFEDEENTPEAVDVDDATSESDSKYAEEPESIIIASLQLYKEALATNDESKISEIEGYFKSIEDEKKELEQKVAALSEELSTERERVLRISADFDNFRKRTERERLSLVTNAQGEVVETLLQVLDNFERAKSQIKIENEGEQKISNSYQSIYKQFVEILGSLGVLPVDTVGKPFDPMVNNRVGSRFSRVIDGIFQMVSKAYSGVLGKDTF